MRHLVRQKIFLVCLILFSLATTRLSAAETVVWSELPAVKKASPKQKKIWAKMAKTPRGLFYSGRYEQALKILAKKSSTQASALTGEILVETGHDLEAVVVLTAALKKFSPTPELLTVRARAFMVSGQYKKAEADLLAATAKLKAVPKPGEMHAKTVLAELYETLARRDDWFAQADWFFDFYANEVDDPAQLTPAQLVYLGRGVTVGEDFKNGLLMASRAAKKDPTFLPSFLQVGKVFAQKYQYDDATDEFSSALKLNPRQPDAQVGLAAVFMFKNKYVEAEKEFNRALQTNPRNLDALLGLASLEFIDEDTPQALTLCGKVLAVNPHYPEALLFKLAVEWLSDARQASAKTAVRLQAVYEELPFASEEIKQAVQNAGASRIQQAISEMLASSLRTPEAIFPARKAVKLDPENFAALAHLATLLMRTGNEKEAAPLLREAFEHDKFNVWLYNLLQLLRRDKEYKVFRTKRFLVKLHKDDYPILAEYLDTLVDAQLAHCEKIFGYKITVNPVKLTIMKSHGDFSARITGLPRLHATGATFGPFVAVISPRAMKKEQRRTFNWESTLLHEIAHVVTLMGSKYRIPRWLTEGISVYSEGWVNPGWDKPFKTMIENDMLPDIAHWNRDFNRPRYGWQVPAAYVAAGKFVAWLVDEYGAAVLPKIIKLYGEGKDTATVFKLATGKDLPALNKWLHAKLRAYAATIYLLPAIDPSRRAEYEKAYAEDSSNGKLALKLFLLYQETKSKRFTEFVTKLVNQGEKAFAAQDASKGNPAITAAILFTAGQAMGKHKFKVAHLNLERALFFSPQSPGANFLSAVLAIKEKKTAAAIAFYQKTIAAYPRFVQKNSLGNPYKKLAELLDKVGKKAAAIKVRQAYCQINRDDGDMLRTLAESLVAAKREKEALVAYRRLIGIDPYIRADHLSYAKLLSAAGRDEDAAVERRVAKACPPADDTKDAAK